MSQTISKKNGKIEFYRFLFCMGIVLFHFGRFFVGTPKMGGDIHLAYFPHGVGVEFFFLTSGFLMAKSLYKKLERQREPRLCRSEKERVKDYLGFMAHKYLRVFPQHMIAFLFAFVSFAAWHQFSVGKTLIYAIRNIPAFFLIQKTGFMPANVNSVTWYISCMLIAMAIIYPVAREHYYVVTRYAAPLISLIILGWMYHETHTLTGVSQWMGIAYKCTYRAIAEILLGMTSFEISRALSQKFGDRKSLTATIAEVICVLGSLGYMMITASKKYEMYVLFMMFIIVTIAFSRISYGAEMFDNKLSYFLGEISLPVYLSQLTAIYTVNWLLDDASLALKTAAGLAILAVVTACVMMLGKVVQKKTDKIEFSFTGSDHGTKSVR